VTKKKFDNLDNRLHQQKAAEVSIDLDLLAVADEWNGEPLLKGKAQYG